MFGRKEIFHRMLPIIMLVLLSILVGCSPKEAGNSAPSLTPFTASLIDSSGWLKVASSGGAFTVRIPDGWQVINNTKVDQMIVVDFSLTEYTFGKKAIVVQNPILKTDGIISFNIDIQKNNYEPPGKFASITRSSFGTVNGLMGIRYQIDFIDVWSENPQDQFSGEREYIYLFYKNSKIIRAVYRNARGNEERLGIVEACIRTMEFQ
jgi:hypothetical protein